MLTVFGIEGDIQFYELILIGPSIDLKEVNIDIFVFHR
jgi:hypothetical protein